MRLGWGGECARFCGNCYWSESKKKDDQNSKRNRQELNGRLLQVTLPEEISGNWTTGGHIGLTASTGQLSDNHDVIRLETFVSSDAARKGEEYRENKKSVDIQPVRLDYLLHLLLQNQRMMSILIREIDRCNQISRLRKTCCTIFFSVGNSLFLHYSLYARMC